MLGSCATADLAIWILYCRCMTMTIDTDAPWCDYRLNKTIQVSRLVLVHDFPRTIHMYRHAPGVDVPIVVLFFYLRFWFRAYRCSSQCNTHGNRSDLELRDRTALWRCDGVHQGQVFFFSQHITFACQFHISSRCRTSIVTIYVMNCTTCDDCMSKNRLTQHQCDGDTLT